MKALAVVARSLAGGFACSSTGLQILRSSGHEIDPSWEIEGGAILCRCVPCQHTMAQDMAKPNCSSERDGQIFAAASDLVVCMCRGSTLSKMQSKDGFLQRRFRKWGNSPHEAEVLAAGLIPMQAPPSKIKRHGPHD